MWGFLDEDSTILEYHPWLLLFHSLTVFLIPWEECHNDNVNIADIGLPSRDLSTETILFYKICYYFFLLQILLFSIIDLLGLLSHIRCL